MKIKKWEELDGKMSYRYIIRVTTGFLQNTQIIINFNNSAGYIPCTLHASSTDEQRIAVLKAFGFDIELIKPQKLSKREHAACEVFGKGYTARDLHDGRIFNYINVPKRYLELWRSSGEIFRLPNGLFQWITWESEPQSIEEMLTWEVDDD